MHNGKLTRRQSGNGCPQFQSKDLKQILFLHLPTTDYQLPPNKFKHLLEEIYVLTCELED